MRINNKILSLPPYISTTWNNIQSLHMKESILVVSLNDGSSIDIPDLKPEIVEIIFTTHANAFEHQSEHPNTSLPNFHKTSNPFLSTLTNETETPFRLGFGSFDALGSALQHNPTQANAPDLPKEVLSKISAIAKIVSPEDLAGLPKPEPHCNCVHCQIARAITGEQLTQQPDSISEAQEEEIISNEELTFCQWEIIQTSDKLYTVINRLDTQEKYSVYLGHPVGCTCGKQGCEHILAVLKS